MVDLDNFKRVNDDYGHQQGDEVLAAVAGVLRAFSRDIDAPARYGGEELAVILPQRTRKRSAWRRIREAMRRSYHAGGKPLLLEHHPRFGGGFAGDAPRTRGAVSAAAALLRASGWQTVRALRPGPLGWE